nr:cell division protein FtsL [Oleiagrimonas sp. C23AA]
MTTLLLAVLGSAIGVVWVRHESRVLFIRLTELQNRRDSLNVEFGRLELEQATWADPSRIDRVARDQLHMVDPKPGDIELIRR